MSKTASSKAVTVTCKCGKTYKTTMNDDGTPVKKDCNSCAFVRLAELRVNNAIAKIELIGNLAGAQYDRTEEQIGQIEFALSDCIVKTMEQFKATRTIKAKFSLISTGEVVE